MLILDKCASIIEIHATENGFIYSPGYPRSILNKYTECWWVLKSNSHHRMHFTFNDVDLPPPVKDKCTRAYVSYGGILLEL